MARTKAPVVSVRVSSLSTRGEIDVLESADRLPGDVASYYRAQTARPTSTGLEPEQFGANPNQSVEALHHQDRKGNELNRLQPDRGNGEIADRTVIAERLMTATDVAAMLGVHPNYVYDLATSVELPSFKIGGNRRFRRSEVERWLEKKHVA
jgi:excisionase family DNA binding protein